MRKALCTLMLAIATTAMAQQVPAKPDFSGTWKLDPAASIVSPAPGTSSGVSPSLLEPISIKQTATTLSLTAKPGDEPFTFTYKLDGTPSILPWPSGAGETVDATAIAKWNNDKLEIATTIPIRGTVYKNTETWSLVRNRLTIELVTSRGKETRVYSRSGGGASPLPHLPDELARSTRLP